MSFATIYTDASLKKKKLYYGYYSKSSTINIKGSGKSTEIFLRTIQQGELYAIYRSINDTILADPMLEGMFINTDSICCCRILWSFYDSSTAEKCSIIKNIKLRIMRLLGDRWIRVKHVKAHSGNKDIRSYMNNKADKLATAARKSKKRKI